MICNGLWPSSLHLLVCLLDISMSAGHFVSIWSLTALAFLPVLLLLSLAPVRLSVCRPSACLSLPFLPLSPVRRRRLALPSLSLLSLVGLSACPSVVGALVSPALRCAPLVLVSSFLSPLSFLSFFLSSLCLVGQDLVFTSISFKCASPLDVRSIADACK